MMYNSCRFSLLSIDGLALVPYALYTHELVITSLNYCTCKKNGLDFNLAIFLEFTNLPNKKSHQNFLLYNIVITFVSAHTCNWMLIWCPSAPPLLPPPTHPVPVSWTSPLPWIWASTCARRRSMFLGVPPSRGSMCWPGGLFLQASMAISRLVVWWRYVEMSLDKWPLVFFLSLFLSNMFL